MTKTASVKKSESVKISKSSKSEKEIFLSVVIPCYNCAPTIERAVESVVTEIAFLNKEKKYAENKSEIILVDDGSVDGKTPALLDEIAESVSRKNKKAGIEAVVLHAKNGGVATARNTGIKKARGKLIAFLDSDDKWVTGSLLERVQILEGFPEAGCVTGVHDAESQIVLGLERAGDGTGRTDSWNADGSAKEAGSGMASDGTGKLYFVTVEKELFKNYLTVQNAVMRRSVFDEGIYFKDGMRYCEELYLCAQIASRFKVLFLNRRISESILGKGRFGDCGLSGNLFKMEAGELKSICLVCSEFKINFGTKIKAVCFSLIKFLRRIAITMVKRCK